MGRIGQGLYRQKTQKERVCGKCKNPIHIGEEYIFHKAYRGGKRIICTRPECRFRPSELTSSDKLATLYGAQEEIGDADTISALVDALDSAVSAAEETAQGYNDSADNMDEYFPNSSQVDEIREKASSCENWQTELEDAKGKAEEAQTEIDNKDVEKSELGTELDELEAKEGTTAGEDSRKNAIPEEIEDLETEIDELFEEAKSAAEEASGSLEL